MCWVTYIRDSCRLVYSTRLQQAVDAEEGYITYIE